MWGNNALVRMQASETQKYRNVLDAFKIIVREEGIAGLYRGYLSNCLLSEVSRVVPTTQRAAILTASQLPAYDQSKQWLLKYGFNEGFRVHVIASMIAGLVCATTTSPIDLVKSRYMNQQFEKGRGVKYVSLWDCIIKTVKYEGFRGLYKGWLPNWLRIGPHTIVTFVVYEKCREVFGIKPI
jgi:solute carrier family 25 protein 14/30